MATKIVTKNSSTASAVPTASDLVQGELAVNVADKRLFTEDNAGAIVELGTNPSTIDINAGSIDGTTIGASSASTGAFTTLTATGAFTSRGIDDNADATAITIDSSENVGIGTSSPNSYTGQTTLNINSAGVARLDLDIGDTMQGFLLAESGYTGLFTPSGSNSLRFGTNNTERMRIDSSGNVGIGTSNIYADLHLQGGQQDIILTNTNADGVAGATIGRFISQARGYGNNGAEHASIDFETNASAWFKGDIVFKTNNSDGTNPAVDAAERMRIDSSGNVGIGEPSPNRKFHVNSGSTNVVAKFESTDAIAAIEFVDSGGSAEIGNSGNALVFFPAGTERMRIDSSGNLLVGKTSASIGTVGCELRNDGYILGVKMTEMHLYF